MRFGHPVYPITNTAISGLPAEEQVARFVEAGVEILQLREKTMSSREFYEEAVKVLPIARSQGVKVIINDRVDLAIATGADGVHLGQDDLSPIDARRILGSAAIIGFSTHTIEQAFAAVSLPVDYIAFGPVFPTSTKEKPDKVTGIKMLQAVRTAIGDFPLVAIGGIDPGNVRLVAESGADAAAVIGALFAESHDIAGNIRKLEESWRIINV